MVKKTDVKAVGIVVVGVVLAGFAMSYFRDVDAVRTASNGYGG